MVAEPNQTISLCKFGRANSRKELIQPEPCHTPPSDLPELSANNYSWRGPAAPGTSNIRRHHQTASSARRLLSRSLLPSFTLPCSASGTAGTITHSSGERINHPLPGFLDQLVPPTTLLPGDANEQHSSRRMRPSAHHLLRLHILPGASTLQPRRLTYPHACSALLCSALLRSCHLFAICCT